MKDEDMTVELDPVKVEAIRAWFRENPSRLTIKGSRLFEVSEGAIMDVLKSDWPITELRHDSILQIIEGLRSVGLVRITVRSPFAVVERDTDLRNAAVTRDDKTLAITTNELDMRLTEENIGKIYALEKRSHMNAGNKTYSFQVYDRSGTAAVKIFLWQDFPAVPASAVEVFRRLVEQTGEVAMEA